MFDTGKERNSDKVKVLVRDSCHCWSSKWDDRSSSVFRIIDGNRERAFDPVRFETSGALPALIKALPTAQLCVTRSESGYGCCCTACFGEGESAYTAYFTMRSKRGKFNGKRHTLLLHAESAYSRIHAEEGQSRTKLTAVIAKARHGKMVKYRHP